MNPDVGEELISALRNTRSFVKWVILTLIVVYLCFGFYKIETEELGVLEIMGKVVDKKVLPGLHYVYLPPPFSKIHKVPVKKSKRLVVDDFYQDPKAESRSSIFYNLTGLESYCLSGDNNTVEIQVVIQYNISDPFNYLFGAMGKDALLRDIICRELIHLLAVRPVDVILTRGRKELEIKELLQKRAQEKLDDDRTGFTITSVDIKEVRPPASVKSYFDDVINAQVDKQKLISRAQSYKNEEEARARADKDRMINEAKAYRDQATKSAQGESERFLKKLSEYWKVPNITRKRLYLEFVRECLSQIKNTYLVDKKQGKTPARLRILSLD